MSDADAGPTNERESSVASGPRFFDAPFPAAPLDCGVYVVEPGWIDYNNHMNVGYYGVAFDRGLDLIFDHWLDVGAGYVSREGMGPFALQTHAHYLAELKLGERFRITLQLLDCDHKRIHYFSRMIRETDGALSATTENISMNIDLSRRRSAPYPDRQKRRIEALMAAHRDLPRPDAAGAPIGLRRR